MSYPTGSTPNADQQPGRPEEQDRQQDGPAWPVADARRHQRQLRHRPAQGVLRDGGQSGRHVAAGGFILPKSRVNVVATLKPMGMSSRPKVVTILQDVLVLAVDTMSMRPDDKLAVGQVSNVLLAVKPVDSQKVALAQSLGEMRLVLRSHDDNSRAAAAGTRLRQRRGARRRRRVRHSAAAGRADLQAGRRQGRHRGRHAGRRPDEVLRGQDVHGTAAGSGDRGAGLRLDKGKTLKHTLYTDGVVTAKHFRGEEFNPVAVKPAEPRHLLFIQNGGSAPQMLVYKNGVIEQPEPKDDRAPAGKDKKPGDPVGGATGEPAKSN